MTDAYTSGPFQPYRNWQVITHGQKPGADLLKAAHVFGRPGKQSFALAMAMRPEGMTRPQMLHACGNAQMNHVFSPKTGLVAAGLFKRDMSAGYADSGAMVYRVTLTAKGQAKVDRALAKAADAGTAVAAPKAKAARKATSKPRKAAKAAPTGEAPPVTPPTGEAPQGEVATTVIN